MKKLIYLTGFISFVCIVAGYIYRFTQLHDKIFVQMEIMSFSIEYNWAYWATFIGRAMFSLVFIPLFLIDKIKSKAESKWLWILGCSTFSLFYLGGVYQKIWDGQWTGQYFSILSPHYSYTTLILPYAAAFVFIVFLFFLLIDAFRQKDENKKLVRFFIFMGAVLLTIMYVYLNAIYRAAMYFESMSK